MRRSPPSLQFLAAAASTDATMYSRVPYRGGRNQRRRGFSDRPFGDGRDQFVTGDSHFQSVRDANQGFRPVERENFANHRSHQPSFNPPPRFNPPPQFNYRPPLHHPPPFNPNQHFRPPLGPPLPFNQNQHFRPPLAPPSPFGQNQPFRPPQQFRPRPSKPLDYRNWEFARAGPPPQCERFTVLSYNILADYLAINHRRKLYFHIPHHILDWEWRKRSIIFELGLWSADILCFQEVDRFQELEDELKHRGYNGIWKMRTGDPVDGCAIFWRVSRFKMVYEECIEFKKLGLRDNVAQICVLESVNQNPSIYTSALPTSSTGSNKVVLCNIHVLYNPRRGEIKLGQIRVLMERAHAVSKLWDDAPVVLCGDFNCTPKSQLYNYIAEQKLNLSELPRDKVSGQAAFEIRAPGQFGPYFGPQSVHNSVQAPTIADDRKVRQTDSLSDVQKQNGSGQYGDENSALSHELTKETHQDAVNDCKKETELTTCVSDSCLKEGPSSSHNEGGFAVDEMKDRTCELTNKDSCREDIYSNVIETGHDEKVHANYTKSDSFSEHSHSNLYTENGSVTCDNVNLSFVGENHSTTSIINPEPANASDLATASSELFQETSFPNAVEVSPLGSSENLSSLSVANYKGSPSGLCEGYESTSNDFVANEKKKNLTHDELDEVKQEDESIGSDFVESNESSGGNVAIPQSQHLHPLGDEDSPSMDNVSVDAFRTAYDPSAWTPMEIETATGNADCTLMEHPLKLRSTYAEVEDCSGTRDPIGEPLVTSYNRCFQGTVDYIWRSEGLQTVRVLAPIPKHAMQWTTGFPTKKWGSDHIALVSELAFTKDMVNQNTEAQ
ncbi:carbon catabolite repressor protein 4 homolog 6 isoform X2 [Cornus florida]|uniref:carbon catabolite repressor protein 4 homolog 6 isoform X2 n=1 Tax=Cornus florida TaxID=4283 RepID=UPI0028A10CEB|nr:carbon catabolite repressor protein 4 homolog 6 isoform X2 [Cornus florida]